MNGYDSHRTSDKYFGILNMLSGKAQDEIVNFLNWIYDKESTENIFKLLLGCDDPSPIINELWFYYITGMDPDKSPTFKEYAVKYIPLSIAVNFQQKDNDLSKKALLVGNIPEKELDFKDLLSD